MAITTDLRQLRRRAAAPHSLPSNLPHFPVLDRASHPPVLRRAVVPQLPMTPGAHAGLRRLVLVRAAA